MTRCIYFYPQTTRDKDIVLNHLVYNCNPAWRRKCRRNCQNFREFIWNIVCKCTKTMIGWSNRSKYLGLYLIWWVHPNQAQPSVVVIQHLEHLRVRMHCEPFYKTSVEVTMDSTWCSMGCLNGFGHRAANNSWEETILLLFTEFKCRDTKELFLNIPHEALTSPFRMTQ